ncbi:hypothetical protein F511_29369 [Dorcoceras hygrometricum]|uniref:Uncharacterized protein n=1 Tax=Dorcoceras hygrometricum TaxID=472368 RepID=A0A2Z7BHZ8_9LAMI|nr:hypothetical protein F511_29369 [Dorcoceras hygrometricum]
MSTPSDSAVSSMAASVDSVPVDPEVKEPWLPDQTELGSSSPPWYEEKSSTLRSSDISIIKEKGGMLDKFEGHCDFLSMQMDSDLMIYRTTLVRTFQVSTRCVLGKWVYLVTHAMSLFDLRDVCIAIGSLTTLDLPMVVDLIGIYVLKGPYSERMDRAALLRTLQASTEAGSSRAAVRPMKVVKKRKATTSAEKEARRQKKEGASTSEANPMSTIEERGTDDGTGPGRASALNLFEDSLVVSPSGAMATGLLCNMVPDRDVARLWSATNSEAVGLFAAQFAVLEELEASIARDNMAVEAEKEALEAQLAAEKTALATDKEAFVAEQGAMGAKLEALLVKKSAIVVELDKTKAQAEAEIGRLRCEAVNAWSLGKEEFLKSSEFEDLCSKRSLAYFKSGFKSCVAQFRANGYSEEEHPTPFLSVARALEELPDEDEEEADEGDDEEDDEGATPPSSTKQ